MALVSHDEHYRRIWMFPRNIRSIPPWKMAQICALFQESFKTGNWSGNQELQNNLCRALESAGLKRPGVQYDPASGGPRTYLSQLRCLGLIFSREDIIWFTKGGEDLVNAVPPLPIMQNLLLRHQYPSIYGMSSGVKINPQIRVKPVLFVLKLLSDSRINTLTISELMIPTIFGHNKDCHEICVRKILSLRAGKAIVELLEDSKTDLYTPRTRLRTAGNALKDVKDIANTLKNYLQSCCLINVEKKNGSDVISFNPEVRVLYEKYLREEDKFISTEGGEESFQRAFGAWDSQKDTRGLSTKEAINKKSAGQSIIKAMFMQYCGERVVSDTPHEFVTKVSQDFGFSKAEILTTIEPLMRSSLSYFEATFLDLSKGGAPSAINFEKAVCNLFQDRLLFKASLTGQKKRQGVGGYADIFLVALDEKNCALVDTKASPVYSLSSSDYRSMAHSYIQAYQELCTGKNLTLEFCLYVAGGFAETGVKQKLAELKKETNIPVSAIAAHDFLAIARNRIPPQHQERIRTIFKKNTILNALDFALQAHG